MAIKKLKVAVVIPTHYNIKSSLHVLLSGYRRLIKDKNVDVTIFTDKKNKAGYKGFKVVNIQSVDYKTPIEKALFALGVPRFYYTDIIQKLKGYDVIETSNPEFYMFAYQSYLAAKKYSSRLVYRTSQTVDGFFLFNLTKYLTRPFIKKAYDFASALLFTNPQAAQRCLRLGYATNKKKFIILGHGIDTALFKPIKVKKSKKKILLSVAGLIQLKGHQLILQALKKIHEQGAKNVELWIVGDGPYKKKLQELTASLGLQGSVKFLGGIGHEKLPKIYSQADIFVLANFQEITPAVSEALACGTPVVVMECGGRRFILPNENYGLVSKKFDVEDMASKIMALLKDPSLRQRIAQKGRKRVIHKFSVPLYAEQLYKAIKEGEK
ncbi:MAG: glycosyltransferase family 4 protein [Flavobacteriales bacterium]|nr:glycosyltransferase family 4 protein [Flavobacteriales bacterium]